MEDLMAEMDDDSEDEGEAAKGITSIEFTYSK